MILFDMPSCSIDCREALGVQGCIAGNQVEYPCALVLVYEDLFDQMQREINSFEEDFPHSVFLDDERVDCMVRALALLCRRQCHLAVAFQGHHKVLLEPMLDKHHVLCRSIPNIVNDGAKCDLIFQPGTQQTLIISVL